VYPARGSIATGILAHSHVDRADAQQRCVGAAVLLIAVMKKIFCTCIAVLLLSPLASVAAERSIVLRIPTMDCATCPITIRLALLKVKGVSGAVVKYKQREARVTYDDQQTSVEALRAATRDVGYPALVD